jgi:hypothetical protein
VDVSYQLRRAARQSSKLCVSCKDNRILIRPSQMACIHPFVMVNEILIFGVQGSLTFINMQQKEVTDRIVWSAAAELLAFDLVTAKYLLNVDSLVMILTWVMRTH